MGSSQTPNGQQKEEWRKNLEKHYDGHRHWSTGISTGIRVRRPKLSPDQIEDRMSELQQPHEKRAYRKRRYLNPWGDDKHDKYPDLDAYYSSTKGIPRRLVVQATDTAREDDRLPRHWGHRRLEGNIPFALRLAELCLNPFGLDQYDGSYVDEDEEMNEKKNVPRDIYMAVIVKPVHWITSAVLTLFLSWIIQILVSAEIISRPWTDNSFEPYDNYENVHWNWPKHAMNILDQSPEKPIPQSSNITKLTVPRILVVWNPDKGGWEATETTELRDENTGMLQPYIFLSFSRANYPADDNELKPFFYSIAQNVLDRKNASRDPREPPVEAFWVDTDCVSHASPAEHTRDVNTICDAVRCAKRVYILLPDDTPENKKAWGKRIWTLPEVLLAAGKIRYCITPSWASWGIDTVTPNVFRDVSLTDMYESFWPKSLQAYQVSAGEGHGERHEDAISHLIDHYTNRTKLSDLQLFTFVVQALAQLITGNDIEGYTTTGLAYATMGLMSYRITPDESDNTFQAVGRLSLVNDSDQLIERLLCLWPYPARQSLSSRGEQRQHFANSTELLRNIADQDQYATHLWDIKPLCDVVGISDVEDTPTVIIDRCRGIPIRWKSFPRLKHVKDLSGFRATMSQYIVYFGTWFFVTGFSLFGTIIVLALATLATATTTTPGQEPSSTELNLAYALIAIAIFFAVGWIISCFSPLAERQLCNGGAQGVSCHLVGFEGTLPIKEIERIIFGNCHDRLSYAASTTPFSKNLRDPKLRAGVESKDPEFWNKERIQLNTPVSHRLLTIVDTGSLTVSVIAAERPPVVALICGREGGMLRTLLCSWRFETNTLYRECVMRMRSSLEEIATPNDWLQISFASQGNVSRMRWAYRT